MVHDLHPMYWDGKTIKKSQEVIITNSGYLWEKRSGYDWERECGRLLVGKLAMSYFTTWVAVNGCSLYNNSLCYTFIYLHFSKCYCSKFFQKSTSNYLLVVICSHYLVIQSEFTFLFSHSISVSFLMTTRSSNSSVFSHKTWENTLNA